MSVKKNFGYSLILTVSNYLFPLLTYPYVSRVLGVSKIGAVNYIDSIINYFVLFSLMGTLFLGIREIAGNKTDKTELSIAFSSIIILNIIMVILCIMGLLYMMFYMEDFIPYRKLLCVGILKLLGTVFTIDWLYKGLEEFKYITKRTIIIKILYVVAIFAFIHKSQDYVLYFFLTTMMFVANTVINCWYSRHFVSITLKGLKCMSYLKPFLILGLQGILTSMYTSFNVAYLGYTTNNVEVGYYTTATKLFAILLAVYSAFSGVLVPRISYLVAQGKMDEFKEMLRKSQMVLLSISIPIAIYMSINASEVIYILAGNGYEGAYLPARLIMPLVLIIGYEQILVFQVLVPLKKDRQLFVNSIIGAIVGISCNLLFVAKLGALGSSIVWLLSELSVLFVAQICVTKIIDVKFPIMMLIKNLLAYMPVAIVLCLIHYMVDCNQLTKLIISGIVIVLYFVFIQMKYLKNEYFIQLIMTTNERIRKCCRL